ncbi:PepSY domain-containing protein [Pedobacter jejuensis]|uniref:FAD-binding oxidoreductase n=1 Tax=Pedobacter jejuensis TaxID=1268550 RepID=A0A3N0C1Q9_9SPHI|nr:PepSY domain-containing protein [Pedobacter jejuensis]RNL56126.1 FAD-binding oxidoreductase [Pedobacter jejuensis]
MMNNFWRYCHLALAVSSFLFLLLASTTGAILSLEPVVERSKPFSAGNLEEITLAQSIPVLRDKYPGLTKISVENNQFVLIEGTDKNGDDLKAYIDPKTGEILGKPDAKNEFFQWVTTLHRSLFLHETGRIFISVTAFLLILISVSGILLIVKRQRGIKRFFAKIPNDGSKQYYHTVAGRLLLVFIFLIAISGTYLSLNTLGIIKPFKAGVEVDFDKIKSGAQINVKDFEIFRSINYADVHTIEFPFSEDIEDYFILTLQDKEIAVNQITGVVLAETKYPFSVLVADLSMKIHTGRASILWSIILGIASLSILFFIYSGFAITLKRISKRSKNKYAKEECVYILLTGSENGSTLRYASSVHSLLLKQGKKAFLTSLNNYSVYPKAEQIIVFTSTYGDGEAPTNANKFMSLVNTTPQTQQVNFSVLGFGSKAYPDFCKFAFDVHNLLSAQNWAKPLIDIHTVDERSPADLLLWQESWSQKANISFAEFSDFEKENQKSLNAFTVKSHSNSGDTILINFKPSIRNKAKSGDLLAIYPANDHRERLYSIGIVDKSIQLSVKLHENGLGSGFLNRLKPADRFKARIIKNPHFNFPEKASKLILISNGTGIAPFLGMIDENKNKISCHLYCGFQTASSFEPFKEFLSNKLRESKLSKLNVAYSRAESKQYVSHLIASDSALIAENLLNGGVVMICGSLSMQKDILVILDEVCATQTNNPLSFYQSRNQILMDCY